jgi:hypothetical protein
MSSVAKPKPLQNRRVADRRGLAAASSTPIPPAMYSVATKRVFKGDIWSGICISAGTSNPVSPMPKP